MSKKPCERTDCLISPIREECCDFCIDNILRIATTDVKVTILGIPPHLAERIFEAYNVYRVRSTEALKYRLGDSDWETLRNIFKGLSQSQLDYFRRIR